MNIYDRQRADAHNDLLSCGVLPMRMPIHLQQTMFEDDNIYHIIIGDRGIGPFVEMFIGAWKCDYWPHSTYERALAMADRL